jgi:TonB family protein
VKLPMAVMVLVLPVTLVSCTARGSGAYADLEGARQAVGGLTGRTCHYVGKPVVPSSIDELTRPGTRGSILLWGRDAAPTDTTDLSVRYGENGRLAWVRAIRTNVRQDRVFELERLLSESLAEEGPADWGVRIRVVGGSVDAVLPSVVCPPEQGPLLSQPMRPVGTRGEFQEAWQARSRPLEVAVELDESGNIVALRVARSSGSRLLDQYALDVALTYRYHPRLHDGIGLPGVLPVRIRLSRR